MIYDIFEAKIATLGLVPGVQLFRNTLPAHVEIGVMVRASLSGIVFDPSLPGWHKTELQIVTRHVDPVEGNALALAISDVLTVESTELHPASAERGPARIASCHPKTLPIQFPRLEGNGLEFSQGFFTAFSFSRKSN